MDALNGSCSLVLLAQLMNKKTEAQSFGFFVSESEFKVWFVLNMVISDELSLQHLVTE